MAILLRAIVLLALITVASAPSAYPKGIPDKVIITGGKLTRPVELIDRDVLKDFNPWTGPFIDWNRGPATNPRLGDETYGVAIYKKPSNGEMKLIYFVRYCPGPNSQPGYVYLPGKDEESYRVNVKTILREGLDGEWH